MESDAEYNSCMGDKLYGKVWKDEERENYKGLIQLVHGMQEHIGRYSEFANFLANNGYIVVGHDHLGHGKTAKTERDLGHFADEDGWDKLVEDIRIIYKETKRKYPDIPYIIMGHSMGSLLVRTYIANYPDKLDGVILSGTSGQRFGFISGKILIKAIMFFKGKHYRSPFVKKLITGHFARKIDVRRTEDDWISRDNEVVDKYQKDEKCGGTFTLQAYYDLVRGNQKLAKQKNIKNTPRDLPILLFSGDKDPVGKEGKGVLRVYKMLKKIGKENVRIRLFKEGRHEMLNEINKTEVYDFVLNWLDDVIE